MLNLICKSQRRPLLLPTGFLIAAVCAAGCSSGPKAVQTGFLSDYSRLSRVDEQRMRFISPAIKEYGSFMIDPVEMRMERGILKAEQSAEVARYMHDSMAKMLQDRGYKIIQAPAVKAARIRIAITEVQTSTWWMNLHPGTKLTGAGAGGAAMEGEIIDSVSGVQLAAVVQAGKGSQFELDTFNAIDDVKDVIDQWVKAAGDRIDEIRGVKR